MSLTKIEDLEVRVRKLVDLVVELRRDKASLEEKLHDAREQLVKHEECSEGWETERTAVRSKIEKVLEDLDFLEDSTNSTERSS